MAVTKLLVYTQSREFDQTIQERIHNVLKYETFEQANPGFLTPKKRIDGLRFIGYSIFDEDAKRAKDIVITLLATAESLRRRANLHDYI